MNMSEKNNVPDDDSLYSRHVFEMVTVANEYCRFLEKAEDYQLQEIYPVLQKIIPLIYLKASLLPDLTVSDEDSVEHYVTEEQWESLFNILHNKFGSDDEFYFVDLLEKSHHDPVKGSMAECFTDAYQDLKDFLLLYQNPLRAFKENAVAECRRFFETRFGPRLINAHAALHANLYRGEDHNIQF